MKGTRRQGYFNQPQRTLREKAQDIYEKDKTQRKKCRATKPTLADCKICTQQGLCITEGSQDWARQSTSPQAGHSDVRVESS